MMFGLPAACLAMYHAIPKEKRKDSAGLYASGALTSFLTGITEPIEFMFLFTTPWLYIIHAFLDGCAFFIADVLSIRIGNSFSGGLIDFLLFGVFQGEARTHRLYIIPIGLIWAFIYYAVFAFCIKKFHVAIPGMEEEDTDEVVDTLNKNRTLTEEAHVIIEALGHEANILSVEACATRLRVAVTDSSLVNKKSIKQLGATAVFEINGGIQAVFGGKADLLSQEINQLMKRDT